MITDQAARLREIFDTIQDHQKSKQKSNSGRAQTIAITSGKGGVGKTNLALNIAIALQEMEKKVLLVDADLNLANLDILMGISPRRTLRDAALGLKSITEVIVQGPGGVHLLPAHSGASDIFGIENILKERLIQQLILLESQYDYIIVDTAAGIARYVIDFVAYADEVIVVISSEPTSIMDAYAVIKVAHKKNPQIRVRILVNQIKSVSEGKEAFEKVKIAADRFLKLSLVPIGFIFSDINVIKAVKNQQPFILAYPQSSASHCIYKITKQILEGVSNIIFSGADQSFFQRVFSGLKEFVAS